MSPGLTTRLNYSSTLAAQSQEILRGFFREFLELFLPEVAARLDFSSLRFPNREVFTAFPEGQRREPDVVAELRTREGEPEIVVILFEVQADVRGDLGKRMLEYYDLLWLQFDAPVFPVLLILQGGREGVGTAEYRHVIFEREVLRFQYARIALARLNAREYVEAGPLGAALSALMGRGKTSEELELRARMLKRVVTSGLDEERQYLLVNTIETYFRLSADERESFRRLVARKEFQEMRDTELTWGDELIQQGLEKGMEKSREEGMVQGKRDTLERLLTAKFGSLPSAVGARIDALPSSEEVDRYLDRVLTAASRPAGCSGLRSKTP